MREIAKEKSNGKLTERIYREFDARFCSLPETPPLATGNSREFKPEISVKRTAPPITLVSERLGKSFSNG